MTDQLTEEQQSAGLATESPAKAGPVRVAWAPVPKVNLLPIEILEKRRFRRVQLGLGTFVVLVVLAAGLGAFLAEQSVGQAQDDLAVAQARVSTAQAEQARFAKVPEVIAQVDAAVAARTLALGNDVLWYRYLNDLDASRPAGMVHSGFTMTVTNGAAASGADPLSEAGVGTLTIGGTAQRYGQVASWLEALNKISGFSSSTLSSAAKEEDTVTFSTSAVITAEALSGRYQKKDG